ncbi:hypothetical protein FE697_003425 [Mumia zhuanghuii]|uniref:PH domain-containing protein n=2 Tax=Mumia TaxID=1546255 RepID=A0ABW1QQB7_9ACTN|nr:MULTISPECIES: hypothetical protein [Mumia]KAA1424962.1 hypothetical protein FE697_003425 [Mumia zhuanghuii]
MRPTTYRLTLILALRLFGVRMMVAAFGAVLAAVLISIGGDASGWGVGVAVLVALLVLASLIALRWPPRLLSLTTTGYQVHRVRGTGVRHAMWSQVERVDDKPAADGSPILVIGLHQGRTTELPLGLFGPDGLNLQREIRGRLDAAHGYRELPPQT